MQDYICNLLKEDMYCIMILNGHESDVVVTVIIVKRLVTSLYEKKEIP